MVGTVKTRGRNDVPTPEKVTGSAASPARQAWEQLLPEGPPTGCFDPHALDAVPDPARRWLTHSIAAGTPLYRAAVAEMQGEIRIGRWLPFEAVQLHAPPGGYIWAARARLGPLHVTGFDRYSGGEGQMRWRLCGHLPLVDAAGPDVGRSAAGRVALDAFVIPIAFMNPAVRWLPSDDPSTVTACWSIDGRALEVRLSVAGDGTLLSVVMDRWGNPNRRPWGAYPCGGTTAGCCTFDGIRVPTRLDAGWFYGTADWHGGEFLRARITNVRYL